MTIASTASDLFAPNVRRRGEQYFADGAVRVEDADFAKGWADFLVSGTGGDYEVSLNWDGDGEFESFDCTCPHFDDGNLCKHLWACVLAVEKLAAVLPRGSDAARGGPNAAARRAVSPPATGGWKQQLDRVAPPQAAPPNGKPEPERRLTYLLELSAAGEAPVVTLMQQQLKQDGQWGVLKPLTVDHDSAAKINAPEDRDLLRLLLGGRIAVPTSRAVWELIRGANHGSSFDGREPTRVTLAPPLFDAVLPALCASGRFCWLLGWEQGQDEARPIAWDAGPPWRFCLHAEASAKQRQWRITGLLVRDGESRSMHDAVYGYASGLVLWEDRLARYEPPADKRWVDALIANGEIIVPFGDRDKLLSELWRAGEPPALEGDPTLVVPGEAATPTGRLVVHPAEKSQGRTASPPVLHASVAFVYPDREVPPGANALAWLSDDGQRVVRRDPTAEGTLMARLLELGAQPKGANRYGQTQAGHVEISPRALHELVMALVDEGWRVDAEGARVRKGGGFSMSIRSGVDWFDLEGGVDFDGVEASLPDLLAALRAGERYIKLGDGTHGLLPQAWLDRYAPLAELASGREGDALRFQPGQALLLDSLLAAREGEAELRVDRKFSALRKRLASFTGVEPIDPPKAFQGELRDYQREGLGWLRFLEKFGFGGCLADDMGLGKTVQVLALLAERRRRQPRGAAALPSLVVAPKSLVHNWRLEAERFAPKLRVADYTGLDRKQRVADLAEHDLVLTTYGTLRKDAQRLAAQRWDYAILDEAQAIKNAASQSAKASRLLGARHRLALSGTPVENHLGELWSIFEFLNPGLLGKSTTLRGLTKAAPAQAAPSDEAPDDAQRAERLGALRRGLAPFILRRTKAQVLPQLPAKTDQRLYCDLSTAERKKYSELRDYYRRSLSSKIKQQGLAKSKIHVLEALLRLRQAACHPGLIDASQASKTSAKLATLLENLEEVIGEGHKALVFSQFTKMLAIVKKRLDQAGIAHEYLDGKTSNRQQRIDRFQSDADCPVFLISLKAGGVGLNLTSADFVYILDPWWNPAVEAQAIDRAHRIGQTKPVFAYRLIARDTVEEKILELQTHKRDLADAIIGSDSSLLQGLTGEDLAALLS